MIKAARQRWQELPRDFKLFLGALCLYAVGGGIVDPAFNNYVRDTFELKASGRGMLEFPRELPGFMVAMTSGMLFFLPEVKTLTVSVLATALGIAGLAFAGANFAVMIVFMMIWSAGMHLSGPMRSSIILGFAKSGKQASMLGRIGSVTTVAVIFGAGTSWLLFTFLRDTQAACRMDSFAQVFFAMAAGASNPYSIAAPWELVSAQMSHYVTSYNAAFILGGGITALGALLLMRMNAARHEGNQVRPKMVLNWKYRVYYGLSVLFGARKQIFITFAPWVLITIYHRAPSTFAALSMAASVVGIFWQPAIGRLIDRFGERVVLMTDGVVLFAICIGYGYAHHIGTGGWVLVLVFTCYILDQLLFSVGMARTTYINKIAERKEDVTASLSMGVTIDHAVSMSIPILGGATWMVFGPEAVFLAAGILAVSSTAVAWFVKVPDPEPEEEAVPVAG